MQNHYPPTILDVEASGFGSDSFPIEIGVKRSDGARFCRLIKPYQSWTHWNSEAESLHGITRDVLSQYGIDGREVCIQLNAFEWSRGSLTLRFTPNMLETQRKADT